MYQRESELLATKLDEAQEEAKTASANFKKDVEGLYAACAKLQETLNEKEKQLSDSKVLIARLTEGLETHKKQSDVGEAQKELAKAKALAEKWEKEATLLSNKLEQAQEDAQMMHSQQKKATEELAARLAGLEEDLKSKESSIMQKEGELAGFKVQVVEQKSTLHTLAEEKQHSRVFILLESFSVK